MNGGCNVMGWEGMGGDGMTWHCGVVLDCNGALCAGFVLSVLLVFARVWVLVCGMIYEGGWGVESVV